MIQQTLQVYRVKIKFITHYCTHFEPEHLLNGQLITPISSSHIQFHFGCCSTSNYRLYYKWEIKVINPTGQQLRSSLAQWLRSLILVQMVAGSIPSWANRRLLLLAPLLHLTCGVGAVEDKDLTVSSDHGSVWLFVHLTLGIIGEQCWKLTDLSRLNKGKNNKLFLWLHITMQYLITLLLPWYNTK